MISTMQNLTVTEAATTPGHALTVGEERKMAVHTENCRSVGVSFVPLVVESLGGGVKKTATPFPALAVSKGSVWGSLHPRPLAIFSRGWQSPYGRVMPHCGFAVCQSDRPQWTAKFDSLTFLLCSNYVYRS